MLIDGNIISLLLSRHFRNGKKEHIWQRFQIFFYILIRWAMFIK